MIHEFLNTKWNNHEIILHTTGLMMGGWRVRTHTRRRDCVLDIPYKKDMYERQAPTKDLQDFVGIYYFRTKLMFYS